VTIEGRSLGERLMDTERPFTVYAPGLAGISREERYLSPGVVRRIVARGDANLVLRNVLYILSRDKEAWRMFVQDMQSIFIGIDVEVAFDENSNEHIQAYFRLPDGPRLPLDAAGTSILQASQIFAYIALFRPQVLILDEPDSHLHPNNQRALCDLIYRLAAEREFQALISTHSRHVLDAMKHRGNVVWISKGRVVDERDLNTTAMLLELGALDSVDYFADRSLRCVVATEDANREPLKALLWSNGFVEDETEVVSYTGSSKLDAALVLGRFLSEKAPHLRLVVHRDGDYMSAARATRWCEQLSVSGVSPFITDFSDVEGYFLSADHLNALNPALATERIRQVIDDVTSDTATLSVEAMVNLKTEEAFLDRRVTGTPPDYGRIATAAQREFTEDPAQFRRGKAVLGRVVAALQKELKSNVRLFAPSSHLHVARLSEIADSIWQRTSSEVRPASR
jgi:energy-coupling factor transporter ATP-binding protein EcfA2